MHRHGYKGRKFGRETGPRQALIKSLAEALIQYESIETTLPKAKEVVRFTEKLITKAKKGDLHNRRQILAALSTRSSTNKLVDHIAPQLDKRNSGYFRLEKTNLRRGDSAQMAKISFVDELKKTVEKPLVKTTPQPSKKAPAKAKSAQPKSRAAVDHNKKAVKQNTSGAKPSVSHRRAGAR